MLIGRALAKGLETFYRMLDQNPLGAALALGKQEYQEQEEWSLIEVEGAIRKAMKVAIDDPEHGAKCIMQTEHIVGAEVEFPHSRPDLITRVPEGLIVTDTKYTMDLKQEWVQKRLAEYDVNHQLWHYAWEAQQFYGEPVAWIRVQLVIGGPSKPKAILYPIRVTPERIAFWLRQAERAWSDYWAWEQKQPWPTQLVPHFQSCFKYGRCDFYEACHDLHGDERKFPALYRAIEKGD